MVPSLPYPVIDALPCGAHRLVMLTDDALFRAVGVRIGFTGRAGGVSEGPYASLNTGGNTGDDMGRVARNRAIVCEAAGAGDARLIVPNQVHGTDVIYVFDERDVNVSEQVTGNTADVVSVCARNVAVLMNFADCLPLIIVSPSGRFAVAHAGWRGAVAHVAARAFLAVSAGDSAPASEYNAYIGPHICGDCFEVGEDVAARFRDEFGESVMQDARHVSLARAVARDLTMMGMRADRIVDAGICTKCNADEYFSYRATQGDCGRNAAIAVRPR